jgi:hypothetical protein
MCKSQYDIEVEQEQTGIERKKERVTMKQLHAHFGFQPPRSPISPTPPEVEIPQFDQRMRKMINSNIINEYGTMFFESGEGSSSSDAPPPPPGSEEVPQLYGVPQGPAAYLLGKSVFGSIALVRPRWKPSACIRFRSREKTLRCTSTNETLMPLMPYKFCCAGKTHHRCAHLRRRRC